MQPGIVAQGGHAFAFARDSPVRELFPGIRLRSLWREPSGGSAHVLEMSPGTSWPRPDVHDPGPEEVYAVAGTFSYGARDYPDGTFLHAPAGPWHLPATTADCTLFPFCPGG